MNKNAENAKEKKMYTCFSAHNVTIFIIYVFDV